MNKPIKQFKPVKAWALVHPNGKLAICTCHNSERGREALRIFTSEDAAILDADRTHRVVPVLISPAPRRGKTNPSKKVVRGKKTRK